MFFFPPSQLTFECEWLDRIPGIPAAPSFHERCEHLTEQPDRPQCGSAAAGWAYQLQRPHPACVRGPGWRAGLPLWLQVLAGGLDWEWLRWETVFATMMWSPSFLVDVLTWDIISTELAKVHTSFTQVEVHILMFKKTLVKVEVLTTLFHFTLS